MAYEIGDRVIVETTFTTELGVPTSPSAFSGWVRPPTGTRTPLTPVDMGSGVLRMTLPAFTEGGIWRWKIDGTAGVIASAQGTIKVDRDVTA